MMTIPENSEISFQGVSKITFYRHKKLLKKMKIDNFSRLVFVTN